MSNNKIPTAKEFCKEKHSKIEPTTSWIDFNEEVMIEFAKMHVEAALKEASESAYTKDVPYTDDVEVDKDSILNSYSLDNIK